MLPDTVLYLEAPFDVFYISGGYKMSIKILFSDLDGTLVEHGGDITIDTLDAVQKLKESHIDLILVSGRHPDMMKSIHHHLNLKTPVIGCNGGIIKDLLANDIMYSKELSYKIIEETISIARELSVDWVVYEKNQIFYEKMPPPSYKLPYINHQLPVHLRSNFVHVKALEQMFQKEYVFLKTLLLFDEKMEMFEKGKQILKGLENVELLRSATSYLDVMPKGISKGSAVKMYLEKLNIDRTEVAAIGDAENDLDMLEFSGLGIAMGNGVESVKRVAKYITSESPNGFCDGVEYLIDYNSKHPKE